MRSDIWYADHEGGTKFYEIVLVPTGTDESGETLEIRRYAAVGKLGQVDVLLHRTWGAARDSMAAQVLEKRKRGYTATSTTMVEGFQRAMSGLPPMGINEALSRAKPLATRYNGRAVTKILNAGSDDGVKPLPSKIEVEEDGSVVEVTPAPKKPVEPDRGDSWGSW